MPKPSRPAPGRSSRSPTRLRRGLGPGRAGRYLAGLKVYVTNIDADTIDGPHVVPAYRELYQVERSFRMAKSDLAARPMFHRIRDSIEAHLTVVFAALTVSREAQAGPASASRRSSRPYDRCEHPHRFPTAADAGARTFAAAAVRLAAIKREGRL